jgi:hypothetical protein
MFGERRAGRLTLSLVRAGQIARLVLYINYLGCHWGFPLTAPLVKADTVQSLGLICYQYISPLFPGQVRLCVRVCVGLVYRTSAAIAVRPKRFDSPGIGCARFEQASGHWVLVETLRCRSSIQQVGAFRGLVP